MDRVLHFQQKNFEGQAKVSSTKKGFFLKYVDYLLFVNMMKKHFDIVTN